MNKKIHVYSHVRSGTHFLMSSLKNNFYHNDNLTTTVQKFGHWSSQTDYGKYFTNNEGNNSYNCEWGGLFGGHNYLPTTKPWNPSTSIYILRDGRDVITSMYNMKSFRSEADKMMDFSTYLRTNLDWTGAPEKQVNPFQNPVEHWCRSTSAWLNSSIYVVRYENLLENFSTEMEKIQTHFNLTPSQGSYSSPRLVGLDPKKGIKGSWETFFSDQDLEFYTDIVDEFPILTK